MQLTAPQRTLVLWGACIPTRLYIALRARKKNDVLCVAKKRHLVRCGGASCRKLAERRREERRILRGPRVVERGAAAARGAVGRLRAGRRLAVPARGRATRRGKLDLQSLGLRTTWLCFITSDHL